SSRGSRGKLSRRSAIESVARTPEPIMDLYRGAISSWTPHAPQLSKYQCNPDTSDAELGSTQISLSESRSSFNSKSAISAASQFHPPGKLLGTLRSNHSARSAKVPDPIGPHER